MNKQILHQLIINALEAVLDTANKAARQAHETATHVETVAENKYDTFGLEASYLASGQAKRVLQAEQDLRCFRNLPLKNFDEHNEIGFGAYIELTDSQAHKMQLFLSPVAGGISIDYEGKHIAVVTAEAPLGKKLLGASIDDEIVINARQYAVTRLA